LDESPTALFIFLRSLLSASSELSFPKHGACDFLAFAPADFLTLNYANRAVLCELPVTQGRARYAEPSRNQLNCKQMESACHLNTQAATLAIHRPCGQHFRADFPQPIINLPEFAQA
jgi:hypothetical protein